MIKIAGNTLEQLPSTFYTDGINKMKDTQK